MAKVATAAAVSTLAVSPTAVGDCLVMATNIFSSTISVASVAGGGCSSWFRLVGPYVGSAGFYNMELWLGVVATTGSSTITLTGTSALSGTTTGICAQQFAGGVGGGGTVWALDGAVAGTLSTTIASTTVKYPTLVPGGTLRCYVGFGTPGGTPSATASSGYTCQLNVAECFVYNPNVSTSQSPTSTQTSSSSRTIGACITATAPPAPPKSSFMPFFMGHHEDELVERRPSGLYVQRRSFGYRRPSRDDRVLTRAK